MYQTLDDDLRNLYTEDSQAMTPSSDKLDIITRKMRETRDLKLQIEDLNTTLQAANSRLLTLTQRELPDLMNEVSQSILKLPAEGNHPPFVFKLKDFYKANIQNEKETAPLAYQWLEDHGEGDLIKRTISVSLGKDSQELQDRILDFLDEQGVDPETKYGIPWNTLTSWLRERHKQWLAQQQTQVTVEDYIEMPPLEIFGATIGQVVEMKESK